MKEIDAINFLENQVLLVSAKDGGEEFVEVCRNKNLSRNFLPSTTIPMATPLEQAQPDTAVGYIREGLAKVLPIASLFTQQEDQDLARFQVCAGLHAPFFTCQWKGAKNPNHTAAQNQGARDGAVIVNYLRWIYQTAESTTSEPSVMNTCHFSATCDISTIILFFHWASIENGVVTHYMEEMDDLSLKKPRDMSISRTFIRNLQDHALAGRLSNIKIAIPKITAALAKKPWILPTPPPDTTTITAPESLSGLDSGSTAPLPGTATTSASGSAPRSMTTLPPFPPPTPTSNTAYNSGSPPPKRMKTQALGDEMLS